MNLSQLDLNLLVALDALLRERNVSHAGESLHLSQPVMSRALSRLRKLFGDPLLVRVGVEYHLTPLAQELQEPVRQILRQIEETVERRLQFDPATDKHVFRIAASDYASFLILKPLTARWATIAPFVSLQVRSVTGRGTVEQIEAGEIDLGIWSDRVQPPHLDHEVLFDDRLVLAAGDNGTARTVEEIGALPQIVNYRDPQTLTGIVAGPPLPFPTDAPVWLESPIQRLLFLQGSNNATLALERLAIELGKLTPLRLIDPPFETPPHTEAMFWFAPSMNDPAQLWLREQVRAICRDF